MGFTLDQVVPWGRSFEEYFAMFALTEADRHKRILGCGDGPASFNAELTKRGGKVVSVDPLYLFSAEDIKSRIDATFDIVMEQTGKNYNDFTWKKSRHLEAVISYLEGEGMLCRTEIVPYEFQKGGFEMLRCMRQ